MIVDRSSSVNAVSTSSERAFDFETIDEVGLRSKHGRKWQQHEPQLAAWTADMDFAPAPQITAALNRVINGGDLGYANWSADTGGSIGEHMPGVKMTKPDTTYLVQLDCRNTRIANDPAASFRTAGVELNSGLKFGPGGKGFVRLNFATSTEMLTRIITVMSSALR